MTRNKISIIVQYTVLIFVLSMGFQPVYPQVIPQDTTGQDSTNQAEIPSSKWIEELVNSINYGVPSSPAFELLPDKPSEVVHIQTGRDVQTNIHNIFDGFKLREGFAFDARPFVWFIGSLEQYNRNLWRRMAWRSVFSVGSAADPKVDNDVLLSLGIRVPLIDKGDPRTRLDHLRELEKAYKDSFSNQPPHDESLEEFKARTAGAATKADSIRKDWEATTWNAFKVEIGLAGMLRAKGRNVNKDSLDKERIGFWVGAGFPIKRRSQLTISGKLSWSQTNSTILESARYSLGVRARFFLTKFIAASIEGAEVWAIHKKEFSNMNDAWFHFAILTEFKVPIIGGWIGIAYGGDAGRRGDFDSKFSINYAYYINRLVSK